MALETGRPDDPDSRDHARPDAASLARAVGINHVALEVGSVPETLSFLSRLFRFQLRSRSEGRAFIELGDQFIALFESPSSSPDDHRHFGLVVDDKSKLRARLRAEGIPILSDRFLDFRDPSGNRWQVIEYGEIEFLKDESVLSYLGVEDTNKASDARKALERKGIGG